LWAAFRPRSGRRASESLSPYGSCDPKRATRLGSVLASGHGDGLSGRCLYMGYYVAELVQRAVEMQREDLYVLRFREEKSR
jgi:hypothetical protein